jgi:hypothetical protein
VVTYEVITYLYKECDKEQGYPFWVEVVINLNHVALAFNAAINIAIYICKDSKFRSACIDLIPWRAICGHLRRNSSNNNKSGAHRRRRHENDNVNEHERQQRSMVFLEIENGGGDSKMSSPMQSHVSTLDSFRRGPRYSIIFRRC